MERDETKPKSGETDGTAHDSVLGDRHLDGMDAVQTVETLTALALAH